MPNSQPWDGKTERRKSALTATEAIIAIHNECNAINERVTQHKAAQDEGFSRLEKSIDRVAEMLVPKDGHPGIIQDIRDLKKEREGQIEQHKTIMKIAYGAITALIISIAAWLGKAVLAIIKIMGG